VSEKDGSAALGAPELAGSFVNPKGLTKKFTAATAGAVVGGALGSAAARSAVGDPYEGAPDVPSFGRVGYLSVTKDEIAIVKTRTGAFSMKITDQVLARVPRAAITRVAFDGGVLLSHLTIAFDNDVVWEFDIPKVNKKTAERVFRVLGPV
jgi:hypothetical protein